MHYLADLEKLSVTETNPVNKMYLNEIKLHWSKVEELLEKEDQSVEILVNEFNKFLKITENKKFRFNVATGRGFQSNSSVFGPGYLEDIIAFIIKKMKVTEQKSIKWGRNSFSTGLYFNPKSMISMSRSPNFVCDRSPEFLSLILMLDMQFRTKGKRWFHKYQVDLPLIVFHTFIKLQEKDVIALKANFEMTKSTFGKSKTIIVTEAIDKSLLKNINFLPADKVFVLRKHFSDEEKKPISVDVITALSGFINQLWIETQDIRKEVYDTGVIY